MKAVSPPISFSGPLAMASSAAALTAGTGESPFTTPFYTACGFVYSHRVENFFTENYPRPITEGGVTLRVKGGEVRVEGEGLLVAQYGGGDLLLRGDVRRIEFCGGGA